jgi:hypothetical protein
MSRKVGMPYRQQPARQAFFIRAQKLGVRSGRLRTYNGGGRQENI